MSRSSNVETSVSREAAGGTVAPLRINVVLPKAVGALRVGDYVPGEAVELEADEAIRLVEVKGFQYATELDGQLARDHKAERAAHAAALAISATHAAATAPAEEAATAAGEGGGASVPFNPVSSDEE